MAKTKVKIETEEQRLKRKAKEQKELAKWEKEAARPRNKCYIGILFVILGLVQCIDEITTSINTQMQVEIAIGLFSDRLSILNLCSSLSLPIMFLSIFYKSMADRYGRKIFLFINTLGMGAALFMIFLAGKIGAIPGIVMYALATGLINFFISSDTQTLFIMESASPEKRQTQFSLIKGLGMLSLVLIPAMRHVFMGSDVTRWNYVYIVPGLVSIAIGIICLLFTKESEVFLANRIDYLKMSDEERQAKAEADGRSREEAAAQGGVGMAFSFIRKHKQLCWIYCCLVLVSIGGFGVNYYEKIADVYHSTEDVTNMLILFPVGCALITWLNGPIGDKLGRKKSAVTMVCSTFISFVVFFVGCVMGWNTYAVGLALGIFVGSRYAAGDVLQYVMVSESTPTNLRASMLSAGTIINVAAGTLATLIPMVALMITKDNYAILGQMCIYVSIPLLALACATMIFKVKDTAGRDLTKITGNE